MKTVLMIILAVSTSYHSFSQRFESYYIWPTDQLSQKIVFREAVHMPDANADTLYSNAKDFVEITFAGEKDTIVVKNDSLNIVVCKGAFPTHVPELGERGKGYISFTLSIVCRNNSYNYYLTDLWHHPLNENCVYGGPLENAKAASGGMLFPLRYWNEQKAKCYYFIQSTIARLKESMNRNTNNS